MILESIEDKHCKSRHCNNILTGHQMKYCSKECRYTEARLLRRDKEFQEFQLRINKKRVYSKTKCRFCKDSDHREFCSFKHEYEYYAIMAPIDMALGR